MEIDPNRLDWNHLRAFFATAEETSLSAAARRLGLTQPTLSRQVAGLEAELGLLLFERVGRRLLLTEAGRELKAHVGDMGEAAQRAAIAATGQRSGLSGQITLTASDVMSAHMMPGFVRKLQKIAPQLMVRIVASNDIQDLMRREADIAIRHVRPEQPDLVARLVREEIGYFYAARSYLDLRGRPKNREEMADHDWVSFGNPEQMVDYMTAIDIPVTVENFRSESKNGIVAWELAKAGLGITPMDRVVGSAAPGMEAILPETLQVTFPIWLVTHREIHTSPRIRLVFDLLAEALAGR